MGILSRFLKPLSNPRVAGVAIVGGLGLLVAAAYLFAPYLFAPARLLVASRLAGSQAYEGPVHALDPVWDFGTVSQSRPATRSHKFQLRNTLAHAVAIRKVTADCGCVVTEKHPTEIRANSVVDLPVSVNIAGRPGPFQKKIAVLVGTDPPAAILLHIQGRIRANGAFVLLPAQVNFGTVDSSQIVERKVRIQRYDNTPIRLVRASSRCPEVSIGEITPLHADASCLELTCRFARGSVEGEDAVQSSILIETEVEGYSTVEIPVLATVRRQPLGMVSHLQVLELKVDECREMALSERSGANWSRIRDLQLEGDAPLRIQLPETAPNAALTAIVSFEGDPLQRSLAHFFRVYVTGVVANGDDQGEHFRIPLLVSLAASD